MTEEGTPESPIETGTPPTSEPEAAPPSTPAESEDVGAEAPAPTPEASEG